MDASQTGPRELSDYLAVLRRRWWIVVGGTALGLVLAAVLMHVVPKHYTSTASVQVLATTADLTSDGQAESARTNSGINLDTQAQLVTSADTIRRAQQLMHTDEPASDLADRVSVTVPPNTTVLAISFDAPTARGSQQGAHAFAQAYLDSRQATAQNQINARKKSIVGQLTDLRTKLKQWAGKVASLPKNSADLPYAKNQLELVKNKMQTLGDQLSPLESATVTPGRILTDAQPPRSPSAPLPLLYLGSGLVAGLLLSILAAVAVDRTDRHIRFARDVERVLDIPVLLDVTDARGRRGGPLGLLTPRGRLGQRFNELAHALTATLGHGGHVILVTGAAPGQGGTTIAANLAAAMARTESGVLLVGADLRSTALADLLGVPDGPGLAEVLLDNADVTDVERRSDEVPALRVITPGQDADLALELLQRDSMSRVIRQLRTTATYIIIEAPSTADGADALALAGDAEAAVVVIEVPRTRFEQVSDGVRQLDRMGAAVVGTVTLPAQPPIPSAAPPVPANATLAPPPPRPRTHAAADGRGADATARPTGTFPRTPVASTDHVVAGDKPPADDAERSTGGDEPRHGAASSDHSTTR